MSSVLVLKLSIRLYFLHPSGPDNYDSGCNSGYLWRFKRVPDNYIGPSHVLCISCATTCLHFVTSVFKQYHCTKYDAGVLLSYRRHLWARRWCCATAAN